MYSEGQINLDKVDEHRHSVQLIFSFFSKGLAEQLIIFFKNYSILSNYFWAFKKTGITVIFIHTIFKSLYLKDDNLHIDYILIYSPLWWCTNPQLQTLVSLFNKLWP